MKNKIGRLALIVPAALAGLASSAHAELTTTAATGAITDAIGFGETIVIAGFAIGALFLAARVIKRGMRSAG